jgi:hypothetical protein
MTQDHRILAPPRVPSPASLSSYQNSFVSIRLQWGVTPEEFEAATDPRGPFFWQVAPPTQGGGLFVFDSGKTLRESALLADVWPMFSALRLLDDPTHAQDPQSVVVPGDRPLVELSGIVMRRDLLGETTVGAVPAAPGPDAISDHVTVLLRPEVLCTDPRTPGLPGVLVVPRLVGASAEPSEAGEQALFDVNAVGPRVREVREGCLPTGKYALRLAYPTSQVWTVPNEAGRCGNREGEESAASCTKKPRPVLASQGPRAVLEIVPAADPSFCVSRPVPVECTTLP